MNALVLLLACVCLVQCGPAKKQARDQEAASFEYGYGPGLGIADPIAYAEPGPLLAAAPAAHGRGPPHPGFSVGGPLVNIATGAAEQAHTQLSNQQSAAGQAAYVAKNTLAQAAAQSAATAAAALTGKQIVVQGLEQQSKDAHVAVDGESLQLQQAERAASAARTTAKQAMHQLQVVTAALNAAQTTADRAAQAAAEAAAELAAQTTMVGQAKARVETVDEQLSAARLDYESTQAAAQKAATAAAAAQNNAAAAAAHVADTAAASALLSHEPVNPAPVAKLPPSHSVLREPTGLRDSGAYLSPAALHDAEGLLHEYGAALGPVSALQSPNGLHRSELLSLANSLPTDYDIKGYRY
ncbi:hypothetical protein WH47_09088 [Habropoda laboriosa]|uniref:Uncharacterized protein n=1 Tax=Habropoda laboriosa TaxID=597456 RepID=A0A0L7QN83_9HYME|nr:hypothetical protein WH47_09088 [Habropoda laboriosa]